jgi:NCAIR mutase (PurE)-related protein
MSEHLKALLHQVAAGHIDPAVAYDELKHFEDLGFVKIDHHRAKRKGFPEVIFGENKTAQQITSIFQSLIKTNEVVLATRVSDDKANAIIQSIPQVEYHEASRILLYGKNPLEPRYKGTIGIVCAGTSDLPVTEEAAITARAMGNRVKEFYDVGIAGIHRLFHHLDEIKQCRIVIAVAGMEAALPSVLGGLLKQPIIAVPTSVGYGSHFKGVTALLSMLNSCSSGITVVNIDNGFGAAYSATLINRIGEDEQN